MPKYLSPEFAERHLASQEQRIAELEEPNRSYLKGYERQLKILGRSPKTITKRLGELLWLLQGVQTDASAFNLEDIQNLVLKINESTYAPISKGKLKLMLKTFWRWLAKTATYPENVAWIRVDGQAKRKLPEQMLTEDDVARLLRACYNSRDKAVISLLWDCGARAGELVELRMNAVIFSEGISHIRLRGKTGDRSVPLVTSTPYLTKYVDEMRQGALPDAPFFVTLSHNRPSERAMAYETLRKILRDLRARTSISKPLNPHNFRHSRATNYANELTEPQMRQFFGWSPNSNVINQYVHLSGRDIDGAVAAANGLIDEKPSMPKLAVKVCIKCGMACESTAQHCQRCGTPLDKSALEQLQDTKTLREEVDELKAIILKLYARIPDGTKTEIEAVPI